MIPPRRPRTHRTTTHVLGALLALGAMAGPVASPMQAAPAVALEQNRTVRHFTQTFVDPTRTSCRGGPCQPRTLVTEFTAPDDSDGQGSGPYPIVLFAHGFNADPSHYALLLDRVAAAGFVVVAPRLPESAATGPGSPIRLHTANQAGDLRFLLDNLTRLDASGTGDWPATIDIGNPTVMGHSDGGIIAAALVETSLADPRFAGAVVIAGERDVALGPYSPHNGRVLVVHGSADSVAPMAGGQFVYDHAANPRAFLVGSGRSHDGVVLDPSATPVRDAIVGWLDWVARFDVSGLGRFWAAATGPGVHLNGVDGIDLSPIGVVEAATGTGAGSALGGEVRVSGWALDPNTTAPTSVRVVIDGDPGTASTHSADEARPDVGAFWKNGDAHGFTATVASPVGNHQICVIAVNVGAGTDRAIGCQDVTVPPMQPPSAPAQVVAEPFSRSVLVHWQSPPLSELVTSHTITCSCGQTRSVRGTTRSTSFAGLADGTPVTFTVTADNAGGRSAPSAPATTTPTDRDGALTVVAPSRVFDTRAAGAPLTATETRAVDLSPPPGSVGAVLSVTALDPDEETFLTVSPAGTGPGDVSSLNVAPGIGPVSNQVIVPLIGAGDVELYNNSGSVDVFVDVMGWLVPSDGSERIAVAPTRILDTRDTDQLPLGPATTRAVHVAPAGTASAVGLVVTTTGATEDSFITAWGGGPKPLASIQNPRPGVDRAANVVLPVDADGDVHLFNNSGTVDVIVDHVSTFVAVPAVGTQRWHPQAPWRLYDSREGDGPLVPSVPRGIPGANATYQANVVATETPTFGHLTAWGSGPWPGTSNLNVNPGTTVAQQVVAGDGATLQVRASNACQVVVDVSGYWA